MRPEWSWDFLWYIFTTKKADETAVRMTALLENIALDSAFEIVDVKTN